MEPAVSATNGSNRGRAKGVRKNTNPTLGSLKQIVGDTSSRELFKQYSPFFVKKPSVSMQDVYKRSTTLLTNLTQITFLATDNPVTCMGEDFRGVQNFKRIHDWPLNDSLVSICYTAINSPEDHEKTFCLDIPAFLHIFRNPEELKQIMLDTAKELRDDWNTKYDDEEMIGKRLYDERSILLDFRRSQYSKKVTELVLVGTTFNHMHAKQYATKNVTCRDKDVFFQIRYQSNNDKKPKKGDTSGYIVHHPGLWLDKIFA